jgi:pimeloyl-ACP methyl ester carboxylesterase
MAAAAAASMLMALLHAAATAAHAAEAPFPTTPSAQAMPAPAAAPAASTVPRHGASAERVGRLLLDRCAGIPAYCGHLDRPLDPSGAILDRISIYFEYYPHTGNGPSAGTLVATEGGPGYPATLSRDDYLSLFAPLRATRDVVLMDNRGTGRSGAIDCHELQTAEKWTVALIGACGASLGARATLYRTAYAADDLAAILEALGTGPIDLYGDSYGTYFEQVFALRHPGMLRTLVLDGAYPIDEPDYAWMPTYAPAMRDKFDLACSRSAACARIPGTSIDHIRPALARLRLAPFAAQARDSDGKERSFRADATALAIVMFGSAPALATVKETDAAARAFADGDRIPLLRLMAETLTGVDSRDPSADPAQWSAGLAAAVMCGDPPQIFDMRLPPAARAADRDRALAERRRAFPETYAPFTIDEYRGMPLDYSYLDQCAEWPAIPAAPLAPGVPTGLSYPDVRALVISGDLDNMTTMAEGAAAAHAFRHGRQVVILNGFHVNALPRARSTCGAEIVRRFIAVGTPGDASCAARGSAVRLVPRFAVRADDLEPAVALPGNSASRTALQLVAAAILTVGDVATRLDGNTTGHGLGLRGGRFSITARDGVKEVVLEDVRWTEDLAVSGSFEKTPGRFGMVRAHLQLSGPDDLAGHLEVRWRDDAVDARAQAHGTLGNARVAAEMPAP